MYRNSGGKLNKSTFFPCFPDSLFVRTVLTDPDLVRVLTDNDFIVWAGDIRQRDAYQGKPLPTFSEP